MFTAPKLYSAELERWSIALGFAIDAHGKQKRRFTHDPYWHHVAEVASIVSHVPNRSIEMVEAALLHDTLEDTAVKLDTLVETFGVDVASYVSALTNIPLTFGNRATRKIAEVNRLRYERWQVKTIKLADVIDNVPGIATFDPSFAVLYLREKTELLEVLRGGDQELWDRAWALLDKHSAQLPRKEA